MKKFNYVLCDVLCDVSVGYMLVLVGWGGCVMLLFVIIVFLGWVFISCVLVNCWNWLINLWYVCVCLGVII